MFGLFKRTYLAMRPLKVGLTAFLTLVATLIISDFPLIQNPKFQIPNSQVLAQTPIAPPTIEQIKQIAKEHKATLVEYSINYDNSQVQGKQQTQESELFIWVVQPTGEVELRRIDLKPLWQKQNTSLSDLVVSTRESIGLGRGGTGSKVEKRQTKAPQIECIPILQKYQVVRASCSRTSTSEQDAHTTNLQKRDAPLQILAAAKGLGVTSQQERQTQQQTKGLQKLYQLLIQPIADLLPKDPKARVVFIPQGSLFLVPFPALQDASGKYLIEQHSILTAPSIQILDFTHQQRQRLGSGESGVGSREFLMVGNPSMPNVPPRSGETPQQLPNLPGAEQEAKEIAQLLNTQAITGKEATKVAILQKMAGARIIHLATQSIVDEVRGIGSAIALAPSGNDNGLLTAEEILNLKLNAELVVLSGCDTGLGKITGDGVIGLSRSFIAAGVPSAIVSLGYVSDEATAFLMTEFYRNLQQHPDKAQALRSAMLTTMKQHPNPRDWAAFTLIGEAE